MTLVEKFQAETEALKAEVEAFLREKGFTPTGFGVAAMGDPKLVFDLREGRSPRASTIDKVREFMRATGAAA